MIIEYQFRLHLGNHEVLKVEVDRIVAMAEKERNKPYFKSISSRLIQIEDCGRGFTVRSRISNRIVAIGWWQNEERN